MFWFFPAYLFFEKLAAQKILDALIPHQSTTLRAHPKAARLLRASKDGFHDHNDYFYSER